MRPRVNCPIWCRLSASSPGDTSETPHLRQSHSVKTSTNNGSRKADLVSRILASADYHKLPRFPELHADDPADAAAILTSESRVTKNFVGLLAPGAAHELLLW